VKRPEITPAFLAAFTGSVPSRLLKKLDKASDLAEGWAWSREGSATCVATDKDAVVTLDGDVVSSDAHLICTCLLAPNCLHRLAVATRLPLASGAVGEATTADDAKESAAGVALDSAAFLAPSAVTQPERAAARLARRALDDVVLSGVRGAGATLQADLLRALHEARDVKLHRLAALLLLTLSRVRAMREGEAVRIEEIVESASEGIVLSMRIEDASEITLVERGLARRTYEPMPPTPLFGLSSTPLWTRTGYSGVITWLVDREGTVFTAHTLVPSDGRGGRAELSVFPNVSLTHGDISRASWVLTHGTRSFDRRLGAGQKARAALTGEASLFAAPSSALFERSVDEQVDRFFREQAEPALLRRAGWDLLTTDAVLLGPVDDETLLVMIAASGRTLRAVCPPDSGEAYRESWRRLVEARGAPVRIVARFVSDRERAIELLSVAHKGHDPERWDLGFDETQLGQKSKRIGALRELLALSMRAPDDDAPEPHPLPSELRRHPWSTLERVLAQAAEGGYRTLPAAREDELRRDQATLRGLGLHHGADLLEALRRAALPRGRHFSGRHLAPDPGPFAAAVAASEVYLRALRTAQRRQALR
jgi:hypothetical protein